MNTMTKRTSVISAVILFVALAAITAAIFLVGASRFTGAITGALVYFALGIVAWYFIHNALHEIFHAVFCVAFYGRVVSVAFCGLYFRFANGFKIGFAVESGKAGWTEFICKRPERADLTLRASLLGGLFGTVTTLLSAVLIYLFNQGFFAHYFVLSGIIPVFYSFAVNFILGFADRDGRLLSLSEKGRRAFASAAARLETESYLAEGKLIKDADPVYMRAIYKDLCDTNGYDYLSALERGDLAAAEKMLDAFEQNDNNADNGVIDAVTERIFINCASKGGAKAVVDQRAFSSIDPNDIRAHFCYRKIKGEREWCGLLKKSYFKACENVFPDGLKKSYQKIGERYLCGEDQPKSR